MIRTWLWIDKITGGYCWNRTRLGQAVLRSDFVRQTKVTEIKWWRFRNRLALEVDHHTQRKEKKRKARETGE